ncbi:acetolactate synthase large subunit [Desulfovibrio sp. OttesenSCG-928-G15]|nr:acetolactate synthase large subunit [Desulfovibrio sp. OttesenSCG-928-G15]
MKSISGAELCIRLLERQGITCITGIPGGFNLPLYDALAQSERIRHVLARHEQGAGFIAQGMARASGRAAVFFATSGPGATNTLTALADAKLDSVPVICITGQVPLSMIGTDAFQEVDIYGMSVPVTKHNFLVRSIEELVQVIPEAFAIAESGRPGPVLVDIPKDIQTSRVALDSLPAPGVPEEPPVPCPDALAQAAALVNAAERPVLLFGGGCANQKAGEAARNIVDAFHIPAAMSLLGLGVIPAGHALSLGMLGMHGARYTNMALEECDLLLVAGARFDDRATGLMARFCPGAKIVHIDTDASEINKLRETDIGIVGDAALSLVRLASLLQKRHRKDWLTRITALKAAHPMRFDDADNPGSAYGIIRQTAKLLAGKALVTTDVGQHQMRVAQAYPFERTGQWLTSGGLGTMGFGLPAAIGAALARPDAPVVCFTGDGSLLMNVQELATAAEENVNVKIILCNNHGLGLVQQQQDMFYGGRLFASRYRADVDFTRIAEGFGIRALNLNSQKDPQAALAKALAESGPCLIEVNIRAEDKVFPMVPPGAANIDMIERFPATGGEHHA